MGDAADWALMQTAPNRADPAHGSAESMPMTTAPTPSESSTHTQDIAARLRAFATPEDARAFKELGITLIPFFVLISAMYLSLSGPYILTLLLAVPTAGFLIRLFIIQHDCGHYAFFATRTWNDLLGTFLGTLTMTPYEDWKLDHALHHAWSGNLDHRGYGDVTTWTVEEYRAQGWFWRLRYRAFRHPIVMFGVIPIWQFVFRHRWPAPGSTTWKPILSVITTNIGLLVSGVLLAWLIGWVELLMILAPIIMIATSIGVWLFFVQHQFEETDWGRDDTWNRRELAVHGSSYYDLPGWMMWLTGNIGIHHAHHLNSRVPFYRLPDAVAAIPELTAGHRLTLGSSLSCAWLALWDEDRGRLVTFREALA